MANQYPEGTSPTVKLKNGSEEDRAMVAVTLVSLKHLIGSDPICFYELVMHCRDANHAPWGNTIHKLQDLALLGADRRPCDSVKNIVLSAVIGEDLGMALGSPVADEVREEAVTTDVTPVVHGYETFCHIMRIVDRIFALIQKVKDGGADIGMFRRNDGANPFFSQTSSGLMLEFYYGAPSAILTPWGKFQFSGGSHHCGRGFDDVADLIRTELAAEVFMPLRSSSMGEHGPIWSIGKIDEVKLPAAALQNAKDFMSYERAKDEWAAMAARHKFEAKHGKGG